MSYLLGIRIRKIWGDILARKGRTALVVLAIMIGVFGASTLVGMNDLIVSQLREDLNPDQIAMTHAYLQMPEGSTTLEENLAFLNRLQNNPELSGIEVIEGQAFNSASWRTSDGVVGEYEIGFLMSYTSPFGETQLEPVQRVVEGRFPELGANEIAVEKRFADEYGLGIGDELIFVQPAQGGAQETTPWTISGTVFQPFFTLGSVGAGIENVMANMMMFANYEDAQSIVGFSGMSSIYVRYDDVEQARANKNALELAISTDPQTNYTAVFSWVDDPDNSFIIGQVEQVVNVLNMLALVSVVVSGLLVINVINAIVGEQKKQIGVMKSLGASRFDNFVIYAGMAFFYGLIGALVGVALAIPVTAVMAQGLAELANTSIEGFQISTTGVLVGLIMGMMVPVVAAIVPVFFGTRVTILAAISDVGIASNWGTTRLSRIIGRLPLPINARQALSNVAQKKSRLALTVFTLMLAAAAFMGVTAVFTAVGGEIDSIFDRFNYEVAVTPQGAHSEELMTDLLMSVDGVMSVTPGYDRMVGLEGYASTDPISEGSNQVLAAGIEPTSDFMSFELEEGEGWSIDPTREGVMLNSTLARQLGKGAGDTIVVDIIGQSYEYEILAVDSYSFQDLIFFNWRDLATKGNFVAEDGTPRPASYTVNFDGELSIEETDAAIDALREMLRANGIEAGFINQPATSEQIAQMLNTFSMIFNLTSVVMAAVGAIGLLVTLSMAVFERQKEIGVMRSIGAGSGTIVGQFLVEGVLVGLLAWFIAIPLSFLLGSGLSGSLGFGSTFEFSYPPQVLVLGLVGIVIIATVASIWPSMSAARRSVSDILRYQ